MDITRITDISFPTDTNMLQLLDCLLAHPGAAQHIQIIIIIIFVVNTYTGMIRLVITVISLSHIMS